MPIVPASLSLHARFTRFAKLMQWLTTAAIVLSLALIAFAAYSPELLHDLAIAKLGRAGAADFQVTLRGQLLAALVLAVPVGVSLYGLLAVRRLFADFARGDLVSERAARQLQIFAATVLLQAPLSPLVSAGLSAALSLDRAPGNRAIVVGFSSSDGFALIVGGVLLAAVTVMREAARIADENAKFV